MYANYSVSASNDEAYERAYEEHWRDVFRLALAWTNDWASAEDLAQDAFLRLWKARARIDWNRPALAWLLVVVRRLATDRFRAVRRRILTAPATNTLDREVVDEWLDVQAALAVLSPLERTALLLTTAEGASYAEAAHLLGTSSGAVRAAASRARDKLERL